MEPQPKISRVLSTWIIPTGAKWLSQPIDLRHLCWRNPNSFTIEKHGDAVGDALGHVMTTSKHLKTLTARPSKPWWAAHSTQQVIFCASFTFSLLLGQDIPPLSRPQACSSQEQHAPNLCSPEVLAVLNHPETRPKKRNWYQIAWIFGFLLDCCCC